LPFFADSTLLYAHRTQVYNPQSNTSTFYYINDGTYNPADFNRLTGRSESISREANNGNYRFAPEIMENGYWSFQNTIEHPVSGLNDGDEFLVGNPYMSSIDMVKFITDNTSTIQPQYRIWNGEDFVSYSLNGNSFTATDPTINPDYVAPMQGFFLKTVSGFNGGNAVKFNVANISTVRPTGSVSNLRSGKAEENILRIQAENDFAVSYAVIGYREKASNSYVQGEDVDKLFSPYSYVPSIYSLAGNVPVDINLIDNDRDVTVPLGIKTEQTGEIRLTFTGMDRYSKVSKIELVDALENRTIDLSGKSSYTYTFNQQGTGIQNGRFSLRFRNLATALPDSIHSEDLNIYGDAKGIYVVSSASDPVQQVLVYDLQGRKVYESTGNAKYYPLPENLGRLPLIVKVATKHRTKAVKLNRTN